MKGGGGGGSIVSGIRSSGILNFRLMVRYLITR